MTPRTVMLKTKRNTLFTSTLKIELLKNLNVSFTKAQFAVTLNAVGSGEKGQKHAERVRFLNSYAHGLVVILSKQCFELTANINMLTSSQWQC